MAPRCHGTAETPVPLPAPAPAPAVTVSDLRLYIPTLLVGAVGDTTFGYFQVGFLIIFESRRREFNHYYLSNER
jgi:hypothetical protein